MLKKVFEINQVKHYIHEKTCNKSKWTSPCRLCQEEISLGDDYVFFLNNHKHFPNSIVHKKCCYPDYTVQAEELIILYNNYKEIMESKNVKRWEVVEK